MMVLHVDAQKDDFLNFIKILNTAPKPITKQFISDKYGHYVSGEITITADGKAKIWMLDSLGVDMGGETLHDACLQEFADLFPNHEIFVSQEQRQNAGQGCSVFALDDSAHMPQLHLGNQYSQTNIWGYLDNASKRPTAKKIQLKGNPPVTVTLCDTPLSLMRTMQSTDLLKMTDPATEDPRRAKEEREITINKKGETAYSSALKKFRQNPSSLKSQNTRLDYKFEKMRDANWEFLESHTPEEIGPQSSFRQCLNFKQPLN